MCDLQTKPRIDSSDAYAMAGSSVEQGARSRKNMSQQFRFDRKKDWNIGWTRNRDVSRNRSSASQFRRSLRRSNDHVLHSVSRREVLTRPIRSCSERPPILQDEEGCPRIDDARFRNYSPNVQRGSGSCIADPVGQFIRPAGVRISNRGSREAQAPEVYSRAVVNMVKDIVRTVDFLNERVSEAEHRPRTTIGHG